MPSSRSVRLLPGLPLLLLAAACGQATPTQPALTTTMEEPAAMAVAPQGEGSSLLASVRAATAAFHDVDKAVAAGYLSPAGLPCDQSPAGVMGIHSANGALMSPGVSAEQPEVLMYLPKNGGGFRLIGVEYFEVLRLRNTDTGAIGPWLSPSAWPSNYEIVNPAPSLFGQTFQGPMPGHTPTMPWHYDLHVWAWSPNPNGTFAQWNPALSCS